MAKWLRSTSGKAYTVEGKTIPPYSAAPLQVTEDIYAKITNNKVIASLIENGGIAVLVKHEDNSTTASKDVARLQSLTTENAKLADRIRELEASQPSEDVAKKAEQFDALKAEAEQTIASKDAEIEALKAQLAEATTKKSTKKSESKAEE